MHKRVLGFSGLGFRVEGRCRCLALLFLALAVQEPPEGAKCTVLSSRARESNPV